MEMEDEYREITISCIHKNGDFEVDPVLAARVLRGSEAPSTKHQARLHKIVQFVGFGSLPDVGLKDV